MNRDPKYYVTYRDVDGLWYVSSHTGPSSWVADGDHRNKMLFDDDQRSQVIDDLKASPRHESNPETGFYQVKSHLATDEDFRLWVGPSGTLMEYLTEGNDKEDLVKLLWERITDTARQQLEVEAEEFSKFQALYDEEEG